MHYINPGREYSFKHLSHRTIKTQQNEAENKHTRGSKTQEKNTTNTREKARQKRWASKTTSKGQKAGRRHIDNRTNTVLALESPKMSAERENLERNRRRGVDEGGNEGNRRKQRPTYRVWKEGGKCRGQHTGRENHSKKHQK